ncbi:hypothetical protein DFJ73DRAFT_394842 [Zopfochytrium polystomum]|nr:hypothetical protein DFJ73DRAFT_394842 [Zopfochytrium polystomum]
MSGSQNRLAIFGYFLLFAVAGSSKSNWCFLQPRKPRFRRSCMSKSVDLILQPIKKRKKWTSNARDGAVFATASSTPLVRAPSSFGP